MHARMPAFLERTKLFYCTTSEEIKDNIEALIYYVSCIYVVAAILAIFFFFLLLLLLLFLLLLFLLLLLLPQSPDFAVK